MRWFWIDRFLEFDSGRRAVAIKNVSLAEEHLDGHNPGLLLMSPTLVIEGMAQTSGLLVGQHNDFLERVVLAKISKARFRSTIRPGVTLTYRTTISDIKPDGAIVEGTCHEGEKLIGEVEMIFSHLDDRFAGVDLFYPAEFLNMLRLLGVFDVGRNPDGSPLEIPAHLLAAEKAAFQCEPKS